METIQAQITLDNAKAIQELQRLNQTITNSFQSLSKTLGDSLGKVDGKSAGQKIANDISSEGKKAGVSFGDLFKSSLLASLASSGIQTAISKAFDFGKGFFTASSQMEDFRASFGALVGDVKVGGELLGQIYDMASKTPFETTELASSAQLLLQYNVAQKDVLDTLSRLGDASGGNAVKMNSLALAYGQVNAAGKATMGDINQMINAGFNPLNVIAQKTGKSMGELRGEVEKGAVSSQMIKDAFIVATSAGGQFYGMMEAKSQTVSGRLSTFSDQIKTIGMSIMGVSKTGEILQGGLFDVISNGIDFVAQKLNLINWEGIGAGLVVVISSIQANFGLLIGFLASNTPILYAIIGGIAGTIFALLIPAVISFATTVFAALSPIILTFAVIAGVVFLFYQAWQTNFMGIQEIVWGVLGAIGNFMSTTMVSWLKGTGEFLKSFMSAFNTAFVWIQTNIAPMFGSFANFVMKVLGGLVSGAGVLLGAMVSQFGDGFKQIVIISTPFLKGLAEFVINVSSSIFDTFTGMFNLLSGLFSGDLKTIIKGAIQIFGGLIGGVASIADSVVNLVGDLVGNVIKTMTPLLDNWIVKEGVKLMGGDVGFIEGLKNYQKTTSNLAGTVKAGMEAALNAIGEDGAAAAISKRTTENKQMIKGIKDQLDGFSKTVSEINFDKIGLDLAKKGLEAGKAVSDFGTSISGAMDGIAKNPLKIDENAVGGIIDGAVASLQNMSKGVGDAITKFAADKGAGAGQAIQGAIQKLFAQQQAVDQKAKADMEKQKADALASANKNMENAQFSPPKGAGGSGGKSEAEKQADEAQKLAEQKAKDEANAQKEIEKLKVANIKNDADRQKASLDLQAKNDLENFKGSESQKAEFAKLQAENVAKEKAEIDKKLAEQNQKEAEKTQKEQIQQQKEVAKTGEQYDNLIGKLSTLNQKQAEYTDKTKESTKMADSQKIADIREQLAKLGTTNFGQMGIITGDTAPTPTTTPTTPINQGQVILSNENPQAQNQPPQPQSDPTTLTKPIDDTAQKTSEGLDGLIEKIKTGISGAISEGAKAITEEITKMDEGVVKIFNLVNEGWITIAQAIGQNVINGIISGLQKGERSIYSAIAALETNALNAVNIEVKSREEFGDAGRGAAMGIGSVMNPNVEMIRGFKPFSAGDFQKPTTNNNQKTANFGDVNISNNTDFDVFKGQLNGIFVG